MIPVTTLKDRELLKEHALSLFDELLFRRGDYTSLIILIEELKDFNFELPLYADTKKILIWATNHGHLEIVKYLVEHLNVDLHMQNDYVLRGSAQAGHTDIVRYALSRGADIHVHDDYALRFSADQGHLEVVKLLVENGADIHVENDSPLRWASEEGHFEIFKYLVEHGANIYAEKSHALRWASFKGHMEIVEYIQYLEKQDRYKEQ